MTSMRVTDLDDFSLSYIWRPYWPTWLAMHGQEWDGRSHLDTAPMGLDETAAALKVSNRWSDPIIDRLRRLNATFPSWVMHPLVDVIRERLDEASGADSHAVKVVEAQGMVAAALPYLNDLARLADLEADSIPKVGSVYAWEPLKVHAAVQTTVLAVEWRESAGYWVKSTGLGGDAWNELTRWIEATVLIKPAERDQL